MVWQKLTVQYAFTVGYMSDVPTSSHRSSNHHPRRPRSSALRSRPETPLILSSFKPIPSISQPTPEEIQRDVDIVFHNMGLDSASPIRHHREEFQDDED